MLFRINVILKFKKNFYISSWPKIIIAEDKCISLIKIVSKFVEKLLKYRILFEDILIFLRHDFRDASLITLSFVVIKICIPKIR